MEVEPFIQKIPKLELHVHIEGTLSPELRWKLAQKNDITLPYDTFEALKASYATMYNHRKELNPNNKLPVFLEVYYLGITVLRTESDFYELAMDYFRKAAEMNVRYVEPFFDVQAHTRRGVTVDVVMQGLRRAKEDAGGTLGIGCNWILCFLRDMSLESAIGAYEACAPYQGVIFSAIGLDSNEFQRPPVLFDALFRRARNDGLKVTSHCDVGQRDTYEHIRQVVSEIADTGLDRIDHGLNAAEKPELMELIESRGLGMTLCPHAYHRRNPTAYVFPLVRKLFDAKIKITINSDDPAYMHDMWVSENLQLVRKHCRFSDDDMVRLQRNAIDICWASIEVKEELSKELNKFSYNHAENEGTNGREPD